MSIIGRLHELNKNNNLSERDFRDAESQRSRDLLAEKFGFDFMTQIFQKVSTRNEVPFR